MTVGSLFKSIETHIDLGGEIKMKQIRTGGYHGDVVKYHWDMMEIHIYWEM